MDKVENVSILDTFENDIELHIQLFCEKYGIEDLRKENQNIFNGLLMYLQKNVFCNKDLLKDKSLFSSGSVNTNYNRYDYKLLNILCDYYIYLCNIYDKEVSINGYCFLLGINTDTVYQWGNGGVASSSVSTEIYEKLRKNREISLQSMLTDKTRKNSVGVLSILNHFYNWQTVYAPKTDTAPQISDIKERYNVELIADVVQSDGNENKNP